MEKYTAQRGQVLPLVALLIVVLMGFTALAVDVGYDRYEKRVQQTAADSAALAGAAEIPFGNVTKSAQYDASQNGFTDNTANGKCTVCVTVNNPYNGDSKAVEVIVSAQHPSFFQRVLGTTSVTVSARAVAKLKDDNGCLYFLAKHLTNFNTSTVNAHNCSIISDGDMQLNNATIDAAGIEIYNFNSAHYAGGTFVTATPAPLPAPVSDPCPRIAGCAYLAAYQPPKTCPNKVAATGEHILPGCYGKLTINGSAVLDGSDSQPYVITDTLDLTATAGVPTLTGTNATIYISPASHGVAIHGSATATLQYTSPALDDTGSNFRGVSFFDTTKNENLDQADLNLGGLIYVPNGHTNLNHSFGSYTVGVFDYVNFNASVLTFNLPGAPAGEALMKDAVLTE